MTTGSTQLAGRRVSIWVKLFVLFHIIAITVFALPHPPEQILSNRVSPGGSQWLLYWNERYLKPFPPFNVYTRVTGFWQYWDMFAPNPAHTDSWGDAEIVYKDGSVKRYQYPRMYILPLWKKFLQERYRKFFERAGSDDYPYLFPNVCLRIAYLNDNLQNPPKIVKFYRHYRVVAEPGQRQDPNYKTALIYSYEVDQSELNRLREIKW